MLIDASHPEETRVLVVNKSKLEDYDVEVESRRPLKGNIYLAKVTRVEPSLQAAFVDFGGNRHGFLAFNEIHPDYYQIPIADREALLAEARAEAEAETDDDGVDGEAVETLGGDDTEEIELRRPVKLRRNYKIQEVIKRRQILLVQVVKEERGTKGAALTTFLSLAGRYCVLMPNTDRGGGISRKIASAADRKRLKSVVGELGIPEGMAVIVRTAGSKRSKAEIRRDFDYLLRLWNQVREMTLNSIAPCLVHEEGDLIKRSIRDIYTKEIDEVVVNGEEGYRMAKDFMKILIPSHAKKVQPYKGDGVPMTRYYNIDDQLESIHSPEVHMKSGAYIVINPTEALVSIDVNSGRSTKERNIEETALRTNIEAAEEIARQLRLRDLAGLIVIDFIDMEVHRNQSKVERALKEAMRPDRARIQIGRISPFGLMEMSRQRLRPSLIETSSEPCPHCEGTGIRRSTDVTALEVIRALEEEGMRKPNGEVTVYAPTSVALFVLNNKRRSLADIEAKYGLVVTMLNDDTLIPPAIRIDRDGETDVASRAKRSDTRTADNACDPNGKRRRRRRGRRRGRRDEAEDMQDVEELMADDAEVDADADIDDEDEDEADINDIASGDEDAAETKAGDDGDGDGEADPGRRRRRGRRGGRRQRRRGEEAATEDGAVETADAADDEAPALIEAPEAQGLLPAPEETEAEPIELPDQSADAKTAADAPSDDGDAAEASKPKRTRRRRSAKKADEPAPDAEPAAEDTQPAEAAATVDAKANEAADEPEAEPAVETEATEPAVTADVEAEADEPAADANAPTLIATPDTAQEAAHTTVVNVGENAQSDNPRRGWWRRA
ncbi:MAG: Rne/Rng family ribonuclease [Rhodospirillaceae bacterium]